MSKRFADTEKYKKAFIRGLPGAYKLLWDYICLDCDHAGVWQVDFEVAQICVGKDMPVTKESALCYFNNGEERVKILNGGSRWLILPFIDFQYGVLNPANKVHASVLSILEKEGLCKAHASPLQGAMDKDMDKDKDKESSSVLKKDEFVLPDWVDQEDWKAYMEVRAKKRATSSPHALGLIIKDLEKLKALGYNSKDILQTSIKSGWTGVFPPKEQYGKPASSKGCAPIPGKYDGIGEKV